MSEHTEHNDIVCKTSYFSMCCSQFFEVDGVLYKMFAQIEFVHA